LPRPTMSLGLQPPWPIALKTAALPLPAAAMR
jgi:hypothetical protein